jgi:hypothetical protein
MLVDLQRRSWGGKKTDRAVSDEVISNKGATRDSGRFVKNLLAGADAELKAVQQLGNAVGAFVYSKALPWSSNQDGSKRGDRLIAATATFEFMKELNSIKHEYDIAVQNLMAVWDERIMTAKQNLGGMAEITDDYPKAAELADKFAINVDLRPVPTMADFTRINVPPELAEALGERHAQQAEVQVGIAQDDLKKRLLFQLERMSKQLKKTGAGDKTRLYDSLVTNMQELVELARTMNMRANPELAALADKIEAQLLKNPVDVYRNHPEQASAVGAAAEQLAIDAAMEEIWK